jgi:hypothetical protein
MGKLNNGVFLKVVGDQETIPQWQQFITDDGTDLNPENGLARFIESYKTLVTDIKTDLQQLADLEVIVLQARALSNLIGNVKLYTVKDKYIYARTNFYRTDNDINELRLLIDPIDLHFPNGMTVDPDILFGNQDFMKKVYDKLSESMLATLTENVDNFVKIYSSKN